VSDHETDGALPTPDIAKGDRKAILADRKPSTLHYGPYSVKECRSVAREHRRQACGGRPFKPGGKFNKSGQRGKRTSCDEYPFASTVEGGRGAHIVGVEPRENNSQGGQFSGFLRRYAVQLKALGGKFHVCVKVSEQRPAGQCPGQ
jgi:hypothetical protein